MTTLRNTVSDAMKRIGAQRITEEIDSKIELCAAAAENLGSTCLFENIKDYKGFRAITELMCSNEIWQDTMGLSRKELLNRVSMSAFCTVKSMETNERFWNNNIGDLSALPIPRFFENDGGKYISAGILVLRNFDNDNVNLSFNRMMVMDDRHLAFNIHRGKHTDLICAEAEQLGERIPAAIVIGAEPAVMLAAASPAPFGLNELDMASTLKGEGIKAARCPSTGILVPAEAEIVIEGYVENQKAPEGPFVDYLGVMHGQGMGRVFTVENVFCADDPIFHALMPGASSEHLQLLALPVEAEMAQRISKITKLRDVLLTRQSGLFHAVASIDKSTDGEAKSALLAMLSSYPFIKHAVVVDKDVGIYDSFAVEKAIALCVQADKDVMVIQGAKATIVDPRTTSDMLGAKMGIDATAPKGISRDHFCPVLWPKRSTN